MTTLAKKFFLASAIALPLIAASVSAQAASTISDRQYFPNQTHLSNSNLPSPYDQTIINYGNSRFDAFNYARGPKTGTRSRH